MLSKLASLFARKPNKYPLEVQAKARTALERSWKFLTSAADDKRHLAMLYVAMTAEVYGRAREVSDRYYSSHFDERRPKLAASDLVILEGVEREIELVDHICSHPEFPLSVYKRYAWVNDAFRDQFGSEHEQAIQELFERAVEISSNASVIVDPSLSTARFRDRNSS